VDVDFEIIGKIEAIETIAVGSKIRVLAYLRKVHGVGRKDMKIKRYLDE